MSVSFVGNRWVLGWWSWEFGVGVSGGELDEKFNAPRTTVFGAGKSSSQVASLCWTLPSL